MSLAETLWRENADLSRAALEHSFVRGLADGSLPREDFRYYVAQDAFYLESFARAYALALTHSRDRRGLVEFSALISGVVEELRLHEGYAERWGVDLSLTSPGDATLAYTQFLLATAALGSVGETCAAMTPCMRLYAFLGQSLAEEGVVGDNPYKEWAETYAAPDFEALAAGLETLLDHYADDTSAVHGAYRRAMELELAFFEASSGTGEGASR
ncbi:MAG: TenA family protein [Rubrobacteraceae bacterium]